MSTHVRARTDSGYCGWWCDIHARFTGKRGWCPFCDGGPEGYPK